MAIETITLLGMQHREQLAPTPKIVKIVHIISNKYTKLSGKNKCEINLNLVVVMLVLYSMS